MTDDVPRSTRLDRWLWAARFYKTRAQAKNAIDGGKVQCDGARAKPSKEINLGATLRIRRDADEFVVVVTGLAERRGSATAAAELYRETAESAAQREAARAERRAVGRGYVPPPSRPDKRSRRRLAAFKSGALEHPGDA
jgi:ribosome-associated heat shock protein Hsp15